MTKAEMIKKYGIKYYEEFKAKCRERGYENYHADIEKGRADGREKYARNSSRRLAYAKDRRMIYRINSRDSLRLLKMGMLKDGLEAHHIKYHADKDDETWINDIVIMSRKEHRLWHREHPEFNALEHVV